MNPKNAKELIEHLRDSVKRYDTVFIIGGGPSVKKYLPDPRILDEYDVICCNDAYKLFPDAMLLHYADKVWWGWHNQPKHDVKNNFNGYISTAALSRANQISNEETRVKCFKNGNKEGGINIETSKLDGGNTGHQAINIAVHMDYKQIVLIGFDMHPDKSNTHWHNNHQRVVNTDNFTKRHLPGFPKIVPFQKEHDFKVYNINPDSAIRCFSFAALEDFI